MEFYHRFSSSEAILFGDGATGSLRSDGGLSSDESLHAVKSGGGSLSDEESSNKSLNLHQSFQCSKGFS